MQGIRFQPFGQGAHSHQALIPVSYTHLADHIGGGKQVGAQPLVLDVLQGQSPSPFNAHATLFYHSNVR